MERPLTSRTRKRIEQVDEDSTLARVMTLEEDGKIAAKTQRDIENGIDIQDYHTIAERQRLELQQKVEIDSLIIDRTPKMGSANTRSSLEEQRASFNRRNKDLGYPESIESESESELYTSEEYVVENNRRPEKPHGNEEFDGFPDLPITPNEDSSPAHISDDLQQDLNKLWVMIDAFKPEVIELETKLQPFLPNYIPAIGDIDPIIKIPMPSTVYGKKPDVIVLLQEQAGLIMLDEPNSMQSDPAVVDLALRSMTLTEQDPTLIKIRQIQLHDPADKGAQKTLQSWIDTVSKIHSQKNNASNVLKGMNGKDFEKLMAEWPPEVSKAISTQEVALPSPDIDLSLKDYVQLCCNIVDIPVRQTKRVGQQPKQYIDSLAMLFSLYNDFQTNQHFKVK